MALLQAPPACASLSRCLRGSRRPGSAALSRRPPARLASRALGVRVMAEAEGPSSQRAS